MNLTDYPTPRTTGARRICLDKSRPKYIVPVEISEQLEREAAAWRAVAEALHAELDTAFNGYAGQYMRIEALVTLEAFDALKSQLTKP